MSEHGLTRMEQLLAFCDWEEKHNPVPGKTHIARWAADEIERLTAERDDLRDRNLELTAMHDSGAAAAEKLMAERDAWRNLVRDHNALVAELKMRIIWPDQNMWPEAYRIEIPPDLEPKP